MGVALADASGLITEANAAFAQFFGITGAIIGRGCAELVDFVRPKSLR